MKESKKIERRAKRMTTQVIEYKPEELMSNDNELNTNDGYVDTTGSQPIVTEKKDIEGRDTQSQDVNNATIVENENISSFQKSLNFFRSLERNQATYNPIPIKKNDKISLKIESNSVSAETKEDNKSDDSKKDMIDNKNRFSPLVLVQTILRSEEEEENCEQKYKNKDKEKVVKKADVVQQRIKEHPSSVESEVDSPPLEENLPTLVTNSQEGLKSKKYISERLFDYKEILKFYHTIHNSQ